MASIKILLWNKKNRDGLFPIAIRIIKDRKPSYIYTGHYVTKEQWDEKNHRVKKSHPNSTRLNNLLNVKLVEASASLLDLEVLKNDTSSNQIKKAIKDGKDGTFFKQSERYLENLQKNGKYNQYSSDKPRIEQFRKFLKGSDITFKDITIPLLNQFRAYLKSSRNVSDRTVMNHFVVIRSVYNQAKRGNLADPRFYPFGQGKIVIKFPDSLKLGFTADEIRLIERLKLEDSLHHHARNLWLFSFYLAGMRASDVFRLTWSEIHDNRLYYVMGKNAKGDSLKIPDKANAILEQYLPERDHTDLIFPDLKDLENRDNAFYVQMKIKRKLKIINDALREVRKLAEISKPMTMHISRHSFGNISGDKIPIQMLQKLYRHSHISTTIAYQGNFVHKDADEALDAVVSL